MASATTATTTTTTTTGPPPRPARTGQQVDAPFRWTALWIAVVLIAILSIAITVGAYIHNLNQTRMVAIFAIGVVSFLGMLGISHQGSRARGFDPGDVRTALTTAFTMVFFSSVGIFLFSTNDVGDFGRTLMDNLTSLFGVVIGFYFASSAAVEWAKVREAGRARAAGHEAPPAEPPAPIAGGQDEGAVLRAQVEELRATVEELTRRVERGTAGA
jgi:hypothetical protein